MARTNYTNLLPFEVWRVCFMLLGIKEHKRLTKTCHFFHYICLAFILKSITYSSKVEFYKHSDPQVTIKQLDKLLNNVGRFQELAKNPRHASLVRNCTLQYSLRVSTSADENIAEIAKGCYGPFVQTFVDCLPSVNLREVQIEFQKNMDKRILVALAALPHLELVSFISAKFGVHHLKPRLKVRKLSINNMAGPDSNPNRAAERLDIFSGELLEDLSIHSCIYGPKIFPALILQGTSKHLTRLSFWLKPEHIPILYLFLKTCPNLESIQAKFNDDDDDDMPFPFPTLPHSTIPHLKSFTGPDLAAEAFIPGRPVRKVCLQLWERFIARRVEDVQEVFPCLSLSTGPLTDLEINRTKCSPEVMALIKAYFPNLTRLGLASPSEKLFPGQDPRDIQFNTAVVDKTATNKKRKAKKAATPPELLPATFHAKYMHVLHWIALKKVDFPVNIETFYLEQHIYVFRRRLPSDCSDSDTDGSNLDSYDSDYGWDPAVRAGHYGKPYTISIAHSVFETLSVHYPALRKVVVGEEKKSEIIWIKDSAGKWSWSRMKY